MTVKDAELCFRIARAASVVGFQHVFPSDLYEFPDAAIGADCEEATTRAPVGGAVTESR